MGTLRRRGNIWWTRVYAGAVRVEKSTGTSDEARAREILQEREAAMVTPESAVLALRVLESYLESKNQAKQLSAKAKQRMRRLRNEPPIVIRFDTAIKRMRAQLKSEAAGQRFSPDSPYHLYGMKTKPPSA